MKIFFFIFFLYFESFHIQSSQAQEIEEKVYKEKSSYFSLGKARSEIFKKAVHEISLIYIRNFIGKKKTSEQALLIKTKIIGNSKKYILLLKEIGFKRFPDGIEFSVLIKISPQNLKELLLDEGLFYNSEGPLRILPVISFVDRLNLKTFRWWNGDFENATELRFLRKESQVFHFYFKKLLRESGFFGMLPVNKNFQNLIPNNSYLQNKEKQKILFLSQYFNSSVVVYGEVVYTGSHDRRYSKGLSINLRAFDSKNGRMIASVSRNHGLNLDWLVPLDEERKKLYQKSARDLSRQILEVWRRGSFGSFIMNLSFHGEMSFYKWNRFKRVLSERVKEIKNVRDRLYSVKKVTFEVDSSVNSKELARIFKESGKNFSEFAIEVNRVGKNQINFDVK